MSALQRNGRRLNDFLINYNHLVTPLLTLLTLVSFIVGAVWFFADRDATIKKHTEEIRYLQNDVWEIYVKHQDYPPSMKEQYGMTRGIQLKKSE